MTCGLDWCSQPADDGLLCTGHHATAYTGARPATALGGSTDEQQVVHAANGARSRYLTIAEREAVVRLLHAAGFGDLVIARRLALSAASIPTIRQRLELGAACRETAR